MRTVPGSGCSVVSSAATLRRAGRIGRMASSWFPSIRRRLDPWPVLVRSGSALRAFPRLGFFLRFGCRLLFRFRLCLCFRLRCGGFRVGCWRSACGGEQEQWDDTGGCGGSGLGHGWLPSLVLFSSLVGAWFWVRFSKKNLTYFMQSTCI